MEESLKEKLAKIPVSNELFEGLSEEELETARLLAQEDAKHIERLENGAIRIGDDCIIEKIKEKRKNE